MQTPIKTVQGVDVFQDPPEKGNRIHFIADLSDDCDGARRSYRLDNRMPPALDDIHASAGWPHHEWWNVLVRDPKNPSQPLVDPDGFCISMTSYQRKEFPVTDRRRYLDAATVFYAVFPSVIRKLCRGVLLGSRARITHMPSQRPVECVAGDESGGTIGEASDAVCKFFDPELSPSNGDDRKVYLFEFWPGVPGVITNADGSKEQLQLQPLKS